MSRFEFLMMIAAVVVAVGMTEIVGGWGRLMRTRAVVKTYWLHLAWTTMILFSLIQYWIGMWSYSELPIDHMAQIFFLIIPSLFGVLAAFAITPDVPMEGELIVRDYYWAKQKAVFLPLARCTDGRRTDRSRLLLGQTEGCVSTVGQMYRWKAN